MSPAPARTTAAFAALVRRHQDRVFGFILRMLDARDEAMELHHDHLVKAWQALLGWRPEARFPPGCCRSRATPPPTSCGADGWSSSRRSTTAWTWPTAPHRGRKPRYASRQRQALLENALQQIAAEHREILLLREIEDLSYAELAAGSALTPRAR